MCSTASFSFGEGVSCPFMVRGFGGVRGSRILLIAKRGRGVLALMSGRKRVVTRCLGGRVPCVVFQPMRFTTCKSDCLFRLNVSGAFISFGPRARRFRVKRCTKKGRFLARGRLLRVFRARNVSFVLRTGGYSCVGGVVSLKGVV